jgi:hypothetical protein
MSDIIYYKNGEETFRISPPTDGTKCPETKLEVKKMTEIEKVKGEIKVLEKKLALLEEIERHNAKPKMTLENEGEFSIVTYDDEIYYRLEYPNAIIWYKRKDRFANDMMLVLILDLETHRLLEDKWNNEVLTQKDEEPYCPDDPPEYDEIEWDEKDNPKSKTIRSIIDRWWMDTFTTHSKWDAEECMDDLADQIEFFYMRNKK